MKFFKDLRTGATIAIGFLLTLGVTVLLAQSLNEFSSGQLISSASINANFSNLKSRLDSPLAIQTVDISSQDMAGNSSWTDVPGLSLTVTTNGSPVWVGLMGRPGLDSQIQITGPGPGCQARLGILRDTTQIFVSQPRFTMGAATASSLHYPPTSFWTIDTPGQGTYTYKIQAMDWGGCDDHLFTNIRLFAIRLHES